MPKHWKLATLAGLALAGAALAGSRGEAAPPPAMGEMMDVAVREADIRFYQARAAADPRSAADRTRLAGLFLQRGRERAEMEDFRRAERAARAALELRRERNEGARLVLASSLLAQHRFAEARREAEALVASDPGRASHRALLAEIQMELGDYAAAAATFGSLEAERGNLAVAPRLARWYELRGRTADARALLHQALAEVGRRPDLPREQAAWFHLRLADLETRSGRLGRAEDAVRAGLALEPADHRLRSAMARVMFRRGRWRDAVAWGRSAGERADLATLALIGDAHRALGEGEEAEEWYRRVEAQAAAAPEPFNRQWTQFRLEHGLAARETLALLRREAAERPDVLGLDLLAWAEHLGGDPASARRTIRRALRLGTRDATLHYHAGMIARASGDAAAARRHLRTALEIDPRLDQAGEVRRVLAGL